MNEERVRERMRMREYLCLFLYIFRLCNLIFYYVHLIVEDPPVELHTCTLSSTSGKYQCTSLRGYRSVFQKEGESQILLDLVSRIDLC